MLATITNISTNSMQRILERHSSSEFLKMLIGAGVGYYFFKTTSRPGSRINRRIPQKQIKNLEILPSIKIKRRDKAIHLHHWLNFTSLYLYLLTRKRKYLRHQLVNGFILGSIYQGLTYKDRFKIIRRLESQGYFNETVD
jgi:hypothetical protein